MKFQQTNGQKTNEINIPQKECITAKSALNISNKIKNVKDSLAYLINDRNNIDSNTQGVYFMTMPIAAHLSTLDVMPDNFDRCTTLFAARKLIEKNWINSKDEYLAPNTEHEKWDEFVNDSLVYSLFHSSSNQSSLRNIEYKGKTWDIKNEFFWMSKDEIMNLANDNYNSFCYNDARTSEERFVYKKLQEVTLSEEARLVLDKANEIVKSTFKYRELFDSEHPEYQIMNWDASYYQMKPMWKEYAKDDFEEFRTLYKQLADKMRPMVYELGFLR